MSDARCKAAEGYTLTRLVLVPNAALCEESSRSVESIGALDAQAKVEIGCRWRPGARVHRDDDTGSFSAVNPPLDTQADILMQRALLKRPSAATVQHIEAVRACRIVNREVCRG